MNEKADTNKCKGARNYYDAQLAEDTSDVALTPDVKAAMESHLSQCSDCLSWQRQITDIIAEASHVHQFDVSEALTQRIMSSVSAESSKKESLAGSLVMIALALVAMAFLAVSGIESTAGLASWAFALVAVAGLAWLVTDTKKESAISETI